MLRRTRALTLLISVALGSNCFAGEEVARLSLQQALKIADESNAEMQAARSEVRSAEARYKGAMAYSNPELELGAETLIDNPEGEEMNYEVGLSQEMEIFGKRGQRRVIARNEIAIKRLDLEAARLDVRLKVKQAYYQVLLAKDAAELAAHSLKLTRRFLDDVQMKYTLGKALKTELLRSRIESYDAQNAVLGAKKEAYLSRASLNILLGRSVSYAYSCSDVLFHARRDHDPAALLQHALLKRADLKALHLARENKEAEASLAKREIIGNPSIGVMVGREEGEAIYGASIGFPLPFWNRNGGEIAEAKNEAKAIDEEVSALKREIELEVNHALQEVVLAGKQVALLEKAVASSNELIQYLGTEYNEGEIDYLVYLEALKKYKETKLDHLTALADYQTKTATLEKTVGGEL